MHSGQQRKALLITLAIGVLLFACRKDPVPSPTGDVNPAPTPFTVALPQWLIDSVGPMLEASDNPLTVEGVTLGRKLFYEKLLSDDGTMSCSTCHVQANGFSDPRQFSIGTNGAVGSRNAMAVINLGWQTRFFWDGRRPSLEGQAHDPVANPIEMRNTWPVVVSRLQNEPAYVDLFDKAFGTTAIDSMLVVKAIAQFERTLISFGSRYDRYQYEGDTNALNAEEKHGMALFLRDAHCLDCHSPELMSDGSLRNNGLDDATPIDLGLGGLTGFSYDVGKFKVPTLRNIAASAPYMHDSRFATLEEVLNFYATGVHTEISNLDGHMLPWQFGNVQLTLQDPQNQHDLVAFLHALTDSTFLTNPAFAQP